MYYRSFIKNQGACGTTSITMLLCPCRTVPHVADKTLRYGGYPLCFTAEFEPHARVILAWKKKNFGRFVWRGVANNSMADAYDKRKIG